VETQTKQTQEAQMQCSTGTSKQEVSADGVGDGKILIGWEEIIKLLPAELEEHARQSGALARRRGIRNAVGLLQLVLAYAVEAWSLRQVGIWSVLQGIADISDVAILKRLRQSDKWLEQLVAHLLSQRLEQRQQQAVRLRLCDATTLSRPGSKGADWRVHVSLNLGEMRVDEVTLTDAKGGEGLQRFNSAPADILVADRAYGYVNSLVKVLAQGACVVRVRWTDLATYTQQGQPFAIITWLRTTFASAVDGAQEVELLLTTPQGCFPLRLVAHPLPAAEVERARMRVRRKAQKRQSTPTAESLLVAEYVLMVTNLASEQWSASQVCELYRWRWQVELYFKRLKSILHLDELRARDCQLARTYILGKLLLAFVLDHFIDAFVAQVPAWSCDLLRPLSTWRLTILLWHHLQMIFMHHVSHLLSLVDPTCLRRFLCNSPRKRSQQDVLARLFVRSLSVVKVLPSLS
jgi:hypothetical protein